MGKIDEERKVKAWQITFHRKKKNIQYFDVSAKFTFNCEKPFLHLARFLASPKLDKRYGKGQYPELKLLEEMAMRPSEPRVLLDLTQAIQSAPLPDDDDDL